MSELIVFVGPKKTGTSWLHQVVSGSIKSKEIRYPSRFGRAWVYRRYVSRESLLIWPYLLHERACLNALLEDAEADGRTVRLLVSQRPVAEWIPSMTRFLGKYGATDKNAGLKARAEWRKVQDNLAWLKTVRNVELVRLIDPNAADVALLSELAGIDAQRFEEARHERVYESVERSRLVSATLVRAFFLVKPFVPAGFQDVTKTPLLRRVFFRRRAAESRRAVERAER